MQQVLTLSYRSTINKLPLKISFAKHYFSNSLLIFNKMLFNDLPKEKFYNEKLNIKFLIKKLLLLFYFIIS